jgi:hypothetical protein
MTCPICGTQCSQHMNELGTWYNCPNHGLVKLVRYSEADNPLAQVQKHDEYVDAVQHSLESTGG